LKRVSDIIICVAGPACYQLAYNLNQKFSINLIDKSNFPRNKCCAGILIEQSVDFLKSLSPPPKIYSTPRHLDLIYLDWDNNIEFRQKRGFQNINRKEFDYWMFKLATRQNNVNFVRGNIRNISYNGKFLVTIETNSELKNFESDILIDASGAHSITKETRLNTVSIYTAIQFRLKQTKKFKGFNYILANSLSDYYSWIVSKGNLTLAGSCFNKGTMNENIKLLKKIFTKKAGLDFEENTMQAAPILRPLTTENIQLIRKNIFVVGEATGLISPSTGEGISYALRSAKVCAEAINENDNLKKAQQEYLNKAGYLVTEIENKIQRAKVLMDIKKRLKLFKSFDSPN